MTNDMQSFNVDFVKKLIEFNFWENRRVWDEAIMPLTDAQFTYDTGYSWGSIQRECVHIMNGERGWLARILNDTSLQQLAFEDFVDRQVIRKQWDDVQQDWEKFANELNAETFFQTCTFEFRGKQIDMPAGNVVFHVLNHGTLHRVEILRMVAEVNQPVDFDLSMMQYLTGAFRE